MASQSGHILAHASIEETATYSLVDVCKNQLDALDRHCLEVVLLGRKKKYDVSCEHPGGSYGWRSSRIRGSEERGTPSA